MPQLLIRNVPESIKQNIEDAAAIAGLSVQAELLNTLQEKYGDPLQSQSQGLLEALLEVGKIPGPDIVFDRHLIKPRDFSFDEEEYL